MTALAVPHVVEQIGSYAGFVAVVGLAVLSALYISQARDLRRLREWAGRAPERAAEQAARGVPQPLPGRTVTPKPAAQKPGAGVAQAPGGAAATAGAAPATAAAAAASGGKPAAQKPDAAPAPAGAAATPGGTATPATPGATPGGAGTATPGAPAPATAAAQAGSPGGGEGSTSTGTAEPDKADAAAPEKAGADGGDGSPPEVAPVPVATGGAKDDEEPGEEPGSDAASNGSPPETAPPPPPPRPTASLPRRTAPLPSSRPSQTAIPPRPGAKRARRGPEPRYIALAVVGVLVVGAGAAVGIPKLLEEDDAPAPAQRESTQTGSGATPSVAPDEITVSVLNGTTVPGLAAQVGDQVENEGFVLGNVTNAAEQQRATSIVMYAPGHTRDARLVARRLRLDRNVEPVDPDSQGLAGDATVVVVVGQDQTR